MILKELLDVEKNAPFPSARLPITGGQRTVALLLGVLTVLIVGGILVTMFKKMPNSTKRVKAPNPVEIVVPLSNEERLATASSTVALPTSHIVKEGENLWMIAEYYYSSGNNAVDIMEANALRTPDQIATGQKLLIPNVAVRPSQVQAITPEISGNAQ